MKNMVVAAFIIITSLPAGLLSDEIAPLSPQQIQEEVDFIINNVKSIHPRPFERIDEAAWLQHAASIKARAGTVPYKHSLREMIRLVAMMEDGHSFLWPISVGNGPITVFPIRSYLFSDGWYILATRSQDRLFAGGRILTIGGRDAVEVVKTISPYVHGDNRWSRKSALPKTIAIRNAAEIFDLLDDEGRLLLGVECVDGQTRQLVLEPVSVHLNDAFFHSLEHVPGSREAVVWRKREGVETPLYLAQQHNNYWFRYLEDANTLYFQFNTVREKQDESFRSFIDRLFSEWDQRNPRQLILDLRHNGGGNNQLLQPLIHGLIKRDAFQEPGRLIILTSRSTFSAAMCCAGWISRNVEVVFAGEPTGARPNHPGDTDRLSLPHSNFTLRVSKYYWTNTLPWDSRDAIFPDIAHPLSSKEYFSGKDHLLEKLLYGEPYETAAQFLRKNLKASDSTAEIREAFLDYKQTYPDTWSTSESEINTLGYSLMRDGNLEHALIIFELNTLLYPDASNTWDSLGEALLKKGDIVASRKAYSRSLELNPDNTNARNVLKKLETGGH